MPIMIGKDENYGVEQGQKQGPQPQCGRVKTLREVLLLVGGSFVSRLLSQQTV